MKYIDWRERNIENIKNRRIKREYNKIKKGDKIFKAINIIAKYKSNDGYFVIGTNKESAYLGFEIFEMTFISGTICYKIMGLEYVTRNKEEIKQLILNNGIVFEEQEMGSYGINLI